MSAGDGIIHPQPVPVGPQLGRREERSNKRRTPQQAVAEHRTVLGCGSRPRRTATATITTVTVNGTKPHLPVVGDAPDPQWRAHGPSTSR